MRSKRLPVIALSALLAAASMTLLLQPAAAEEHPQPGAPGGAAEDGGYTSPFITATPEVDDNGVDVILEVRSAKSLGETVSGPGPAWLLACTWRHWTLFEKEAHYSKYTGAYFSADDLIDPEAVWVVIMCSPSDDSVAFQPAVLVTGVLATWPVGDPPPQVVLDWLVARTVASLQLPLQVGQSAPPGDQDAPMITQLPIWLWVDPTVWAPLDVTSPSVFGITVTVTANPTNVTFTTADEILDCGPNLGPAYNFNLPDNAQQSDCTLIFKHSSTVGDWELTSAITWELSYTCSVPCGVVPLPDLIISNTRDVRVAELQAILITPTT